MWLVRLAITRPIFVCMIEAFLMVLGLIAYQRLGVDLFPKVDPPIVTVTTEYPGAGPAEIESLISKPIEEQINEIGSIERLVSTSRENISQVVVEFKLEIDARRAQIDVQDKVSRIRPTLPVDAKEPLVQRMDFADRPILRLSLRGENSPESLLRRVGEEQVKPRLQQVEGVGQIDIFGGQEREIQINLRRQAMLLWNLSPADVADAVTKSNRNIPAGEVLQEPSRQSIRVLGEYRNVDDVAATIVKTLASGQEIRVSDLGDVRDSFKDRTSLARVNGAPVVMIELKRQSGTNTVEVSNALLAKLPEVNGVLPAGMKVEPIFDGARQVKMALHDVFEAMFIAALLAIIVVYFFLGSLESTLITGLALPSTLIATCFGLYIFDFTINTMTLLGLTLSVGLILDDAIVVRENIWRKIEAGIAPKTAAYDGTKQVFVALMATTGTVLATFFPVTLIPGIVGRFFSAFALTVCIAIVLSTFDALTMGPMMSAHLTRQRKIKHDAEGQVIHGKPPNIMLRWAERFGHSFSQIYLHILDICLKRPAMVLGSAVVIFFLSLGLPGLIGFTFLPVTEYGEIEVGIEAPIGTTINKTDAIVARMEKIIRAHPAVQFVSATVGNSLAEPHIGGIFARLKPSSERDVSTAQMKGILRNLLAGERVRENLSLTVQDAGGGGGGQRQVTVVVQGPNFDKLYEIAGKVLRAAPKEAPEVVNLTSNLRPGRNEQQFVIDRRRSAAFGLSSRDVGQAIRGFFEGFLPTQYRIQGEEFDLRVRLRPEDRVGLGALDDLRLPNSQGAAIPLSAVTSEVMGVSPTKIVRIDQARAAMIEGDLEIGQPLGKAIGTMTTVIQNALPPEGYRFNFQGQARSMRDLGRGMVIALTLGSLFIYMIMAALYESLLLPFAILLTMPLAIVGAFLALLATGKFMDIYAVIGIILLMGLVTKNAILLVDYVEQIRRDEKLDRISALLEGGKRRLRPIMMTTVAMIAGMLPIAVGFGELNKARSGMGVAAIGGLVSSTLLSLVVVPCAYIYLDRLREWFHKFAAKRRALREGAAHRHHLPGIPTQMTEEVGETV